MNIAWALIAPPNNKTKSSVFYLNLGLAAALAGLVLAYLYSINSLSTKGYEIRGLEQKLQQLESQSKHLEMRSAGLQSISRIQQEARRRNLVPVGRTTFIKDSDFALKQ